MKTKVDNRIVVDLNKCQFARFYYKNQFGDTTNTKPLTYTTRGCEFKPAEHIYGSGLTLLEFAQQRGLVDEWVPQLKLQLSSNHSLHYTGDKAVKIYKEWCGRIFNR